MEDRRILVDTTVLIDFLRKKNKNKSLLWRLKEEYKYIAISVISVFELFAGATDTKKEEEVRILLKWFDIIDLCEEIAETCGKTFIQLRKNYQIIDFRDLFIGISALYYDLDLITLNIEHFERIPDLKLIKKSKFIF
ncbi:MAG: type II toxin-antitoxin system VapC family toxin [Candidatus Cloacimonetes bacterium]|nr:type II toxin-antitoxin system VapC family toxin [Candidatus Cloacimonadota bacterium]